MDRFVLVDPLCQTGLFDIPQHSASSSRVSTTSTGIARFSGRSELWLHLGHPYLIVLVLHRIQCLNYLRAKARAA